MGEEQDFEVIDMKDVQDYVHKHGVSGIEEFIKPKLEGWKDVTINIGVTGNAGVGKSSFINAIRGIEDEKDELAAKTGVNETTKEVTAYPHPTNDKINFWDLPGIGTPNFKHETYCEKVGLEEFDTFLILAAERFTENDLNLAKKVKSMKKSFFFIRTKIDQDSINEKRREKEAFDEKVMLEAIMNNCLKNLKGFVNGDEDVFLISNHHPTKWDFARLTQAILDVLPLRQRECLTLTLDVMTSLSADILRRKAEILRARIWKVATASGAGALVPLPGVSVAVDLVLTISEVNLYKTQLGLPDEDSFEFRKMTPENQERIRKFCITTATQLATLMATYAASSTVEEVTRYIPVVGSVIAGGISFSATYYFLDQCLNELEKTALAFLDELATRAVEDMELE